MAYQIQLRLPGGWQKDFETFVDESGVEISHVEAHHFNHSTKKDEGMMDIYVGEMPEDSSAEEQAFVNYVDTVGFDEDDPEDFNPIFKIQFNGKSAWGFDALCEDDSPMRFLSQEVKKGVLAIICIAAKNDAALDEVQTLAERNFRVQSEKTEK